MMLSIEGMHCGGCVKRVRAALEKVPGAKVEEVAIGKATVSGAEAEAVVAALAQAGYPARVSPT